MNKMTFPNACQVMRWHFHPLGFEASMDAPRSMVARLFDRATGETLLAIAGIPCAAIMAAADVERIIEAVEAEMDAFIPAIPCAMRSNPPPYCSRAWPATCP